MAQVQRQRSGDSRGQPLLYNTSALCTSWLVTASFSDNFARGSGADCHFGLSDAAGFNSSTSYGCSEGDDDDGIEHDVGDGELITIVFAAAGGGSVGEDKRMPITAAGNDE